MLENTDVILGEDAANLRAKKRFILRNRLDSANQIGGGRVLKQIASGSGLQSPHDIGFIDVHTQNDHGYGRMLSHNRFGRLDAVENRHAHVHHHHIWFERRDQLNRFTSVLAFADNFQIGLALKQRSQPRAHNNMVVSQQYPELLHGQFSRSADELGSGSSTRRRVPRAGSESTFNTPPS